MSSENIGMLDSLHKRLCDVEDQIKDSKVWLGLVLDISNVGTWTWDPSKDDLYWDEKNHKIFGTNEQIFTKKASFFFKNLRPDDRLRISDEFRKALDKSSRFDYCFRFVSPLDSSIRQIRTEGRIFRNWLGRPNLILGVCTPKE